MKLRCLWWNGNWFAGVDKHKGHMPAYRTLNYGSGVEWAVKPEQRGSYQLVFAFIKGRLINDTRRED